MLDHTRRSTVLRTNQAVLPTADHRSTPALSVPVAERPGILTRMARAAQDAVREARHSGDVPLPHLYRGRDFRRAEDARAA